MNQNFTMIAKTFFGFEDILFDELKKLGAQNIEKGNRMVSFVGDKGFMYKANLSLRTALKILKPIHTFNCTNENELYNQLKNINWEDYFSVNETFAIETTVNSENFNHSQYVALKSKDAIVDFFKEKLQKRPSVNKEFPNVLFHIHIDRDKCTVSLDTSGDSLHHRGYRAITNIAPINEVLAAGILLLSGWEGNTNFLDPMCGSGTILIEAAMIACNIPANINRKEFAFERWKDWDEELFNTILDALLKKTKEYNFNIMGYDKAPSAIRKAKENIANANLSEYITLEQKNFFETKKTIDSKLHIVFNPPYGERLNIDLEDFYKEIGNTLKKDYPNTDAWFITGNLDAIKYVGLRPSRKIKLFNGKIETRLLKYEMYEGSKKAKFN